MTISATWRQALLVALLVIPSAGQTIPETLTLPQAIDIALSQRAEMDEAREAINARIGAATQADRSPNPTLFLQSENWRFHGTPGFSAGRDLDLFAFVSQPLETAGKKTRRVALAGEDRRIAELRREAAAWSIRQEVKLAYWNAVSAGRYETVLAERREAVTRLVDYHEVRVRLGAAAKLDLIKVQLESEKLEMQYITAQTQAEQFRLELAGAMGTPSAASNIVLRDPDLPDQTKTPQLEDLIETALRSRIEVRLARAMIERARAQLNVQQASAKPDVTPYFGYKRTGGFNTLIGGVSVPLAVFDKRSGAIEEAASEVREIEASLRSAEARVRAEVTTAATLLRRRADMLSRINDRMLGRADETARVALAAYEEGGTGLLSLIDAQRTRNEVGLLFAQASRDYALGWVDLESAVGAEELLQVSDASRTVALTAGGRE
ncbi:MAG: TolC family protein [Acidobacteria bacterium]|nr:TolC family protein [Acidobacteriota bacterium]